MQQKWMAESEFERAIAAQRSTMAEKLSILYRNASHRALSTASWQTEKAEQRNDAQTGRGEATRAPQAKMTRRSGARAGKEREQKARTKERGRRDGRSGRIEATAQGEHEACDEAQRRLAGTAASSGRRRPARRQRGGERRRRATDAGRSLRRLKNRLRFRCAPPRALRMSRSRRRNPSAPPSHAWMRSGRSPSALAKIHRKTYNTVSASLDLEPGRLDLPHRRRGGSNPASASRGPCAAPTQKPENL